MRVFFNFLARRISYTFALAFFTLFSGWISVILGYFLGILFLISSYQEAINDDLIKWLPVSILIVTLLYYMYFGLLTPIRIPAFLKSFRLINRCYYADKLRPDVDDEELRVLFRYFSRLPVYNMIAAVLFSFISGVLVVGLIYINHITSGTFSVQIFKDIIKSVSVGMGVTAILYGMTTYLLTDIITSRERTSCYNELRSRNYNIPPMTLIGVSVKFSFFLILMVISLLTFGALIERGRFYGEANLTLVVACFIFSVLIGFLFMYVNASSLLRIFADISRVAKEIAAGGEARFQVLPLEREFGDIEYTIMEMKREIDEHRKNLEIKVEERTLELQNALSDLKERDDLVQRQLDMASTIQRGLLPGSLDDWNELKFYVKYIAMEKIGGDFYDVHQLKGNKLSLIIADVSGHGIPAALVSAMAKISFGNAYMKYDSPRRIFQEVNQDLLEHIKSQDYLTCFIIVIDDEYNVTYANASHQKGILLRTDEARLEYLDTDGLFIGAIEDAKDTYEERTIKLNYGDRIILYTDGIPEATNNKKEEYSNERLKDVIIKNKDLQLTDFSNSIIEDVQRFMSDSLVHDDITLIVIELKRDETIDIIKDVQKQLSEDRYNEAIESLKKGLTLYPNNQKLLYNLAKSYYRVNDYRSVVECINKYIDKEKENKYAYYIGGAAYYQMLDYNNAIELFQKALNLDPNFVNALLAMGMAYKKNGIVDDAIHCFEKVSNIDMDNKMALYELNELKSSKSS